MSAERTAYCLLSLPNCSLRSQVFQADGLLELESVTVPASDNSVEDICLVLKCGIQELPIEPSRICTVSGSTFAFEPTQYDFARLVLDVRHNDTELLQSILGEYCDLRFENPQQQYNDVKQPIPAESRSRQEGAAVMDMNARPVPGPLGTTSQPRPDLAGQLVLMNEDNGEIVGQVSEVGPGHVHEQALGTHDPVIVEVDEDDPSKAMEFFVRAVPANERDWISWGAIGASKVITGGTTLLISGFSAASNLYMKHSKPAGSQPNSASSVNSTFSANEKGRGPTSPSTNGAPPVPGRVVQMMTSPRTKASLQTASKYSGKARVLSGKTVSLVDDMIRTAVGRKPNASKDKSAHPASAYAPQPSTSRGPNAQYTNYPPHPYGENQGYSWTSSSPSPPSYQATMNGKPPLPARNGVSEKPPLPPRSLSPFPPNSPSGSVASPTTPGAKQTNTKARLLLSVNLILDTIDHSTARLLEAGTEGVGKVMGHKYGKEAGDNSLLAAGAAKNVALVYVDVKGFAHRALLKRTGKHFIKARMENRSKSTTTPH